MIWNVVILRREPMLQTAPLEYGAPKRNILPRLYLGRAVDDIEKDDANKELFKALSITIHGKTQA